MRDKALKLLKEYTKTESLLKHAYAVEAGMQAYARKYGEDEEYWGVLGLIHDIDYEMYPETHPEKGLEILKENDYPDDIINAVKGHAEKDNKNRQTKISKALYAVDECASFIVTIGKVRPTRLEGMKYKSFKKKFKSKSFAEAINRDELKSSASELGEDFVDHINLLIKGLQDYKAEKLF